MISIKNTVLNKTVTLKDYDGDYVLNLADFGQAPATHNTIEYINLVGSEVMSSRLNKRTILIKGTILKEISTNKNELNRIVNPNHVLEISFGKYKILARPDKSVTYSAERTTNNNNFCEFLIQATAFEPVFRLKNEVVYHDLSIKPVSLFPLKIPKNKGIAFGFIPAFGVNNVPNDGDIDAGFIIKFQATEGPVTNPIITNNKTGEFIEAIIEMYKGDVVEISTQSGNKYAKLIRGESETDIFKHIAKSSTMSMTLGTGVNDLNITAGKNQANMATIIAFTPLFLEVQ